MTTATLAAAPVRPPSPAGPVRPANRLAQNITGRPYLSHSQLSLFRTCPRKFSFQYVQRSPRDFIASSLIFGGAIHAALELHFRARLEGLDTAHQALLSAYHDAWNRQRSDIADLQVRFNKGEDLDTLHTLADRMLTAFTASALAQPKGAIVGVEEELRVTLDPQLPDVLARVDLVTQTDGALHVVDWKTSRCRWTPQKALESADQLLLYGVTAARMSRSLGLPVKLHFGIITKHKVPVVQVLPVPTDADRVASLKQSVAGVWQAMQSGHFYPCPSPQNCTNCPFRSRCPVFGS